VSGTLSNSWNARVASSTSASLRPGIVIFAAVGPDEKQISNQPNWQVVVVKKERRAISGLWLSRFWLSGLRSTRDLWLYSRRIRINQSQVVADKKLKKKKKSVSGGMCTGLADGLG
jgi:hypothetical protein